ncbi:MAG: hypothetical protein A2Z97_00385 [Bdellovibrionales bacterium GWB1_52_6]|nr:MAG: hypothetical protein A2Z97_00385 [Bdellovibrionales bacterium GWB1_52_6]OFZ03227.1 MAG: hypothetical protein A2X97_09875 [Bdellovibrionales bacterium GWA1_52_35]HCM40592.1 hypothetical protein [Bdellovibrionales bacterium]
MIILLGVLSIGSVFALQAGAQTDSGSALVCYQAIEIADRTVPTEGTSLPAVQQMLEAIAVCEREMLPDFTANYRKMKKLCITSWAEEQTSEGRASMVRCQMNAARYIDSLNSGI